MSCAVIQRSYREGAGWDVESVVSGFAGPGPCGGMSHRAAGERFGVSAASVSRWRTRERNEGDARPKALGGDRKSHRIDAHEEAVVAALGPDRDRTIDETRQVLASNGLVFGFGTLQRFFRRHKITLKKRPHMRASRAVPTS